MARRNRSGSPLDDFFAVLLLFPWWATLIMGGGLWVYLRWQPSPAGFSLDKPVMIWYGLPLSFHKGITMSYAYDFWEDRQ